MHRHGSLGIGIRFAPRFGVGGGKRRVHDHLIIAARVVGEAAIAGIDRIPATPFDRGPAPRKPVLTPLQLRTRRAKRALAARGLVEAVTWSFITHPAAERA